MELIRYTEVSSLWLQGVTGSASVSLYRLHKCSNLTLGFARGRCCVHVIKIWIIVRSHRHRCCDGDSARGSSQLSMAPCYRSQLIDGAHVSRLRLSTAGRGHSAQMWSVDHTQHSFQLGEPLSAYTQLMCYYAVLICLPLPTFYCLRANN